MPVVPEVMGAIMERFAVEVRCPRPARQVVHPVGVCDMETVPALARALSRALAARPQLDQLLVDCAAVEFCSSSGLDELLRTRQAALDLGIDFRLARIGRQMARLLEITGADKVFTIDSELPSWAAR